MLVHLGRTRRILTASWPRHGRKSLNQTSANETDYCSGVAIGIGAMLSDIGAMLSGIRAILSIKLLALQKKSIP